MFWKMKTKYSSKTSVRGRVINGSKADVTDFLCVSLGSSTVELHGSLGSSRAWACSEAGFSSRNDGRAWGCTTELHRSVVRFLWAKELSVKGTHKEISPVYGRKCLTRKAVHNWVENVPNVSLMTYRLKWRCGNGQQSKRLPRCGFRCDGTSTLVEDMSRNKCLPRFGYRMFYVLYPLWRIYWLSLVPTKLTTRCHRLDDYDTKHKVFRYACVSS
jgi:hypothetical protein